MFAGQEKSSIDNYAGISSLNSRIFFCSKPKIIDKFVFILPIDFIWKYLLERKNAILAELQKQFCWNLDFLAQNSVRNEQNRNFFSETVFHRSVSWTPNKAILTTLRKWFRRKTKFYRLKAEIDRKTVFFPKETIFWEKLPSTRRKQFWSSFRCNFCCSPAFSAKNCKKLNKSKHISRKSFSIES